MMKSPKQLLFMVWGWLAVPWTLAVIAVAFWLTPFAGVGLAVLALLWLLNMGRTTCSRCSSYGTGRCGVQSWIVPLFWAKKSMRSASPWRVRLNLGIDVLMMATGVAVFAFVPIVLPFFLAWLFLGWFVVYRRKENHGLLPLLRAAPKPLSGSRLSLPVVAVSDGEAGGCGGMGDPTGRTNSE